MAMYDIIIIGAGTAGISAYQQASKITQNILIINHGAWDTTCARVGCMPSKVLISSANRALDIHTANKVGLKVDATIDTQSVMSHLRSLRDRFTHATLKNVEQWPNQHKISGQAYFINANTIKVNGEHYQAKSFIIAVGSKPNVNQEWKDELGDRLITSDQVFELETLPQSIAVIGSGVIALELAQALKHLGVNVTVFARSKRIGIFSSPTLQQLAQDIISPKLNILFETLPTTVKRTHQGVEVLFKQQNQNHIETYDYMLLATGRESLLKSLNLEKINPTFENLKKLPIDKNTKQLADYPIFIAGDAYTTTPVQHEAAHEGKFLVNNCLNFPKVASIKTLTPLGIVFSQPEMAIAGKTYTTLKDEGKDFVVGSASYEKQGRALVLGKNEGAIEIYIDRHSHKILGTEIFMDNAEHLAHLLAWMIDEDCTLEDLLKKPYYHPTVEEGLRSALKHARRQLTIER